MVSSADFLLFMVASQLRFSTLPPAGSIYSYTQYAASTTPPLPFAANVLAYQFLAQKVAPEFGRELYLPSGTTDSSALRAEATRLSGYQQQPSTQDSFLQFWDSVSDGLERAWRSIRVLLR